MSKTVVINAHGGSDALCLEDRVVGDPGPGEIRIAHRACGLNFIDVYQRSGLYPMALPHALGMEGAGIVEAIGDGVKHLRLAIARPMPHSLRDPIAKRALCLRPKCALCQMRSALKKARP